MNNSKSRKIRLILYLCPGIWMYIVGVLCTFVGIVCIISGVEDKNAANTVQGIVFTLIVAGVFLTTSIMNIMVFRKTLASIAEEDWNVLINDFENGRKAFNKSLIIGSIYILGKHSGEIIRIESVKRAYQYLERDAAGERLRSMRLELPAGKKVNVGKIPLWGKANDELSEIFDYIQAINPLIVVGFNQ